MAHTNLHQPPPCFKLTPELISQVFLLCRDLASQQYVDVPAWVSVTQVCQHWRSIALAFPLLWARLEFTNKAWTQRFLELSKAVPLEVHVRLDARPGVEYFFEDHYGEADDDEEAHIVMSSLSEEGGIEQIGDAGDVYDRNNHAESAKDDVVSLARRHLNRIRVLTLAGNEYEEVRDLLGLFETAHAPALEYLDLCWKTPSGDASRKLFAGGAPCLRTLRIHGPVELLPTSPLFANLEHLEISHSTTWTARPMEDLLFVLRQSPQLTTLVLEHCLPLRPRYAPSFTPADRRRDLVLPHLRKLRLKDWAHRCDGFLCRIALSSTTTLHVKCILSEQYETHTPTALSDLCAHFPRDAAHPIRRVAIDQLCFRGWPSEVGGAETFVFDFQFEGCYDYRPATWVRVARPWISIPLICAKLPLADTARLSIGRVGKDLEADSWSRLADSMPQLRAIHVDSDTVIGALTLQESDEQGNMKDPVRLAWARLEEMSISLAQAISGGLLEEGVLYLVDALKMRRRLGSGLKSLNFTDFLLSNEQVEELRSIVPVVIVNDTERRRIFTGHMLPSGG